MATVRTDLCKVIRVDKHYYLIDVHTGVQYDDRDTGKFLTLSRAYTKNVLVARRLSNKDTMVYELTNLDVNEYINNLNNKGKDIIKMTKQEEKIVVNFDMDNTEEKKLFQSFLHNDSTKLKPNDLYLPNSTWKMLIRNCLKGKNIMIIGHSGCGKTRTAFAVGEALSRPTYYFNLGSTQDPRAALIGNTHLDKEHGTYFEMSAFVQAIQEPNAVIIMDELSRGNFEAWNISMPVFDINLRCLRVDEDIHSPVIRVAKGVSFIATANIGNEYTATRTMDRALLDRFFIIEVAPLDRTQEFRLLQKKFPNVDKKVLGKLCDISADIKTAYNSEARHVSTILSTRQILECGECLDDGFLLNDVCEKTIYSLYSADGGLSSERAFVQKLVQKHLDKNVNKQENENRPPVSDDTII